MVTCRIRADFPIQGIYFVWRVDRTRRGRYWYGRYDV
jgi:hypothetical protein